MANYHVVPRGDAVNHCTRGDRCACVVDVKLLPSPDYPGTNDTWIYHRMVSIEEAVVTVASILDEAA